MSRTLILACAFALAGQSLPAQQSTVLSGRTDWTDQAPRVRVAIDGPRFVNPGMPMRVRFEVSDNAFVTVVRVDENGRMSILFPYARNQRAAARGGMVHHVRNPRLGDASFVATDRMGGYVFALASYAPLDFTSFENRDYDRAGGWSAFTQVNRTDASRPDVFIDRFAATVLWDRDTPYDYDVDYYTSAGGVAGAQTSYAMCGSLFSRYGYNGTTLYGMSPGWGWSDWDMVGYPYGSMCRNMYNNLRCFSYLSVYSYSACRPTSVVIVQNPTQPVPVDTAGIITPNEGVVRGGMAAPTPAPVLPGDADPPPVERPVRSPPQPKFAEGNDWDKIMSIPARATRRMKEEDDVRRERASAEGASPVRTARERPEVTGKRENPRTTDASTRSNSPPREPTRVREAPEPRRERPSADKVQRDYGAKATGTSAPRPTTSSPGRTIETKPTTETKPPATTGTASKPPSTTTTEKPTKPPQDER